jgi:hypothetical protein
MDNLWLVRLERLPIYTDGWVKLALVTAQSEEEACAKARELLSPTDQASFEVSIAAVKVNGELLQIAELNTTYDG